MGPPQLRSRSRSLSLLGLLLRPKSLSSSLRCYSSSLVSSESLKSVDAEIHDLLEKEKCRQSLLIDLCTPCNFSSFAVADTLFSFPFSAAAYKHIENLCNSRALELFRLDPNRWGVKIHPYDSSGLAILAVSNAAVRSRYPKIKMKSMALKRDSGGYIYHGTFDTDTWPVRAELPKPRVSVAAATYADSLPYNIDHSTGLIDYDELERKALSFRPDAILCGGDWYPRDWDYARLKKVADKCGGNALLVCDISSIGALVVAQEATDPFDYCDIVITTTHNSLRGPRSGMIFYRKGPKSPKKSQSDYGSVNIPVLSHLQGDPYKRLSGSRYGVIFGRDGPKLPKKGWPESTVYNSMFSTKSRKEDASYDFEDKINSAVSSFLQGNLHNHQITSLAVALKQALSPEFKAYAKQVKANAVAVGNCLMSKGYKVITDGTDNHIVLWDLGSICYPGNLGNGDSMVKRLCGLCNITIRQIICYGSARNVLCIDSHAMTSRGLVEKDFEQIVEFLLQVLMIAKRPYMHTLMRNNMRKPMMIKRDKDVKHLEEAVKNYMKSFDVSGFHMASTK